MIKMIKSLDTAAWLTAFYASIVWMLYIYVNILQNNFLSTTIGLGILFSFYFVIKNIMEKIRKFSDLSRQKTNTILSGKMKRRVFAISAILVFLVMMLWLSAYYPGSFSPDSMNQYWQVVNGTYSDWHPVWHTLIFFTIPLKIFGTPASIIVMQMIYFSLILGFLAVTIFELSGLKAAVLSVSYIILNPYTGYIMLYPWKDIAFALAGLWCSIYSVRLICQRKRQIPLWKLILFGFVLASGTIFRHNAILFTGPLLLVLFFHIDRKAWIKILAFTVSFLFLIKIPVYKTLHVEKPGQRVLEATGLPLTVIGNVAKETPELMDEELSNFAYSVATPEQWQNEYSCGNFNSIKWYGSGINTAPIEEQGFFGMLHLMFKCFKLSPAASFTALVALTDMVYGFETGLEGDVSAGISDNPYGIAYTDLSNERLQSFLSGYASFINSSIFRYLRTYGICLFVLLAVFLGTLNLQSWDSWKKTLMVVPIFSYDFGTMLLLSGPDSRFFYITFLVTPLLIVYALHRDVQTR